MLYEREPAGFNPKFEVSSCFCEVNGEILLLKRQGEKTQAGKWGMPGGKLNAGETSLEAVIRETKEETGIDLTKSKIDFFKKVFVRYSDADFIYNMFHARLNRKYDIYLSDSEHEEYLWVTPSKSLDMDLVEDMDSCIKMFYGEAGGE